MLQYCLHSLVLNYLVIAYPWLFTVPYQLQALWKHRKHLADFPYLSINVLHPSPYVVQFSYFLTWAWPPLLLDFLLRLHGKVSKVVASRIDKTASCAVKPWVLGLNSDLLPSFSECLCFPFTLLLLIGYANFSWFHLWIRTTSQSQWSQSSYLFGPKKLNVIINKFIHSDLCTRLTFSSIKNEAKT